MNKYFNWAMLTLILASFVYIFLPSWLSLTNRWSQMDGSYSHGYLVLMVSIYYTFQVIRRIDARNIKQNYYVIPVLALCSLVWTLSYHANIEVIHQSLLPVMLILIFILLLGIKVAKFLFIPVLFLFMAFPIWDVLIEPLQIITVFTNTFLLSATGIPAFIDGFFVSIPSGNFEVAGGCSGLRYLIVALTLSMIYSYQNYSRWHSWLALLLTGLFFALLANWLRVFTVIVIGYVTDMQSPMIEDHDFLGWIIFAITLIPFFYLAFHYAIWFDDDFIEQDVTQNDWPRLNFSSYVLAFLATFLLPMLISPVKSNTLEAVSSPVFSGEKIIGHVPLITPVFDGADATIDELFKVDNGSDALLQVSFRRYINQEQGKEMISYKNHVFSKSWRQINQWTESDLLFNELKNKKTGQTVLVSHQYSISGYKVNNRTLAKLLEMLKPLMSDQSSSILILATTCRDSCDSAKDEINLFLNTNKSKVESL